MKHLFSFLLLFSCLHLSAQNPLKTRSVSVFKDGKAFFVKEVTIKTQQGRYFWETETPPASFGTFWLSAADAKIHRINTHTRIDSSRKTLNHQRQGRDFQSMLAANLGKKLVLHISDGQEIPFLPESMEGGFLLGQSEDKWLNLNLNRIVGLEFAERPNLPDSSWTSVQMDQKPQEGLMIEFDNTNATQQIELMYLRNGIGWVPSYHLELLGENKAALRLQASVINQAEDLVETDLNFVVGVPNFLYRNQSSVLAWETRFDQLLAEIRRAQPSQGGDFANRGSNTISYTSQRPIKADPVGPQLSALQGTATEDLFFYRLPGLSMKKGEKALFQILSAELPVRHLYEVRLEPTRVREDRRQQPGEAFSFETNFKNKVWHTLKLRNQTKLPLTAGAVMVSRKVDGIERPISQDKMNYVSPGGETYIKLTASPDVSVRDSEREIDREVMAIDMDKVEGYDEDYDRLTIEGKIDIRNNKNKAISLNVRRMIQGELKSSEPDWLTAPRIVRRKSVNGQTDVCWELKLKAGEAISIRYQYEVLVVN
ncbi:MAG: hypothetical protein AAF206_00630 [Bacteroidota bacterium]